MKLWASSEALDTDFTAKLVDVYPPTRFPSGVDLNIADSIVRARYRNSLDHEELLEPGKPYEFTIEMYPTSLVFKRGHRIRARHLKQQLPAVRHESEHGRAAQQQPPLAGRRRTRSIRTPTIPLRLSCP